MGSGLAEGDGEGVSKRVVGDLDPGEGVPTQVGDSDGGSGESSEDGCEASASVGGAGGAYVVRLAAGMAGIAATTKLLVVETALNVNPGGGAGVTAV